MSTGTGDAGQVVAWREWLPVLLPWSCLALLPFGRLVEIPVGIMALAGLVLTVRRGRPWLKTPGVQLLTAAFLCIWIPMLLSGIDAVSHRETLRVILNHLRFYLCGLYLIDALSTRERLDRFVMLCAWLLLLWLVDALVQWVAGVDLLGQEGAHQRVTGPFGTRSAKFGLVLATVSPLLIEHARRRWPPWTTVAVAVALGLVVFIGGTRAGWVTAAVVGAAYVVIFWVRLGRFPWRAVIASAVGAAMLATAASAVSPKVRTRIETIAYFFQSDSVNALDHRRWIWRGGLNVFVANPVNGVGARGFRHAFPAHAAPGDPYVAGSPPTHSHQLVVELLAETGLIGIAGLVLLATVLIRAFRRALPANRALLAPFGLSVLAAWWPINTHLAPFSAFWSQVLWWLVGLYCAAATVAAVRPSSGTVDGVASNGGDGPGGAQARAASIARS